MTKDQIYKEFIDLNKELFPNKNVMGINSLKETSILIEGFATQDFPNYLLTIGRIISNLNYKFTFSVLLKSPKKAKRIGLLESYGYFKPIFYYRYLLNIPVILKSTLFSLIFTLNFSINILVFRLNNVLVGDLIYDTILSQFRQKTISRFEVKYLKIIFKAFFDFYCFTHIIKKFNPVLLITSHVNYVPFGILSRICHSKQIPVLRVGNNRLIEYNNFSQELYVTKLLNSFKTLKQVEDSINNDAANKYIESRVSGLIRQHDVVSSFANKKKYTHINLNKVLNIQDNDKRIKILVATHIFTDSPNCSIPGLFKDYYIWLTTTLKLASSNNEIIYIIKEHPSASIYQEGGWVGEIVEKFESENIKMLPNSVNTKSLLNYIDYTITYSGTIGIEFACFGIPTILAGNPFYKNLGISINSENLFEYALNINPKSRVTLNEYQIKLARMGFFNQYYIENNVIENEFDMDAVFTKNKEFDTYLAELLIKIKGKGYNKKISFELEETINRSIEINRLNILN